MTSARARPAARAWPARLRSPLVLVGAVTLAAAGFRLYQIGVTRTNPFYDAAVRSMGQSWHNFFFGAFEPSGSVSVDKPPLDLWLQVASTKLFGFNPAALILPQALAATAAVPLLYDLVRRVFGRPAGIAAAAALAVLPVAVVTARSDTMDSLMMALSVLAAWLVLRAVERREARWLYAAALVVGLNFEVKLFEALAAVPALALLYLLAANVPLRRRFAHLALAGVVAAGAALWWPVAVSLSSGPKPFPIGSADGSVWNVMFVYNGTARVHPIALPPGAHGGPGPGRLFGVTGSIYGGFVGIELLAALVLGSLALLLFARRSSGATPIQRAFVAFLALWLVPTFLLYSAVGIMHLRYLEALTPAIAAVLGIAVAALVTAAGQRKAAAAALVVGLAVVVAYAFTIRIPHSHDHTVSVVAGIGAALMLSLATARGHRARPALAVAGALALVCLLAGSVAKSVLVVDRGNTSSGRPGYMPPAEVNSLASYLGPRTQGDRYELASAFYAQAGPIVARDGRPVMVLTSVRRHAVVRVTRLVQAVRRHEVRFMIVTGSCGTAGARSGAVAGCPPTVRWARAHSVDVTKQAGLPGRGLLFRFTQRG
jgi:4-amino-4-deoxy-L-arabinose transferase-like glycosyltransferase